MKNNIPENSLKRNYRLTPFYSVEMTAVMDPLTGKMVDWSCEWDPHVPSPTKLQKLMPRYERARASFMEEIATLLGGPVVTIDMEGKVFTAEPATKQ